MRMSAGGLSNLRSIRIVPPASWFETRAVALPVLAAGILAWLWPIGIGGMMPSGRGCDPVFPGVDELLP